LNLGARKPRGIDIDWFNPYGDQVTHFIICTKSLNAPNSYNCQKKKKKHIQSKTSYVHITTNKRKTQVGWDVVVGRKSQN
jgi:hypothetical protein